MIQVDVSTHRLKWPQVSLWTRRSTSDATPGALPAGETDKCFKLNSLQNGRCSSGEGTVVDFVAARAPRLNSFQRQKILRHWIERGTTSTSWPRTRFQNLVEVC